MQISRWIKDEGDTGEYIYITGQTKAVSFILTKDTIEHYLHRNTHTVCANSAGLADQTIKIFSQLVSQKDISDNNDHNPNVVDVSRYFVSCDGADVSKVDLGKIQGDDG